ncbi:hypothetical protein QQ045_001377 [Rhodiola kirilowii]
MGDKPVMLVGLDESDHSMIDRVLKCAGAAEVVSIVMEDLKKMAHRVADQAKKICVSKGPNVCLHHPASRVDASSIPRGCPPLLASCVEVLLLSRHGRVVFDNGKDVRRGLCFRSR